MALKTKIRLSLVTPDRIIRPTFMGEMRISPGDIRWKTWDALGSLRGQRSLAWLIALVLIAVDSALVGQHALVRYQSYHADAFDLGNMDQAVWNTLHGYPLRFTNQGMDWYGPLLRATLTEQGHTDPPAGEHAEGRLPRKRAWLNGGRVPQRYSAGSGACPYPSVGASNERLTLGRHIGKRRGDARNEEIVWSMTGHSACHDDERRPMMVWRPLGYLYRTRGSSTRRIQRGRSDANALLKPVKTR